MPGVKDNPNFAFLIVSEWEFTGEGVALDPSRRVAQRGLLSPTLYLLRRRGRRPETSRGSVRQRERRLSMIADLAARRRCLQRITRRGHLQQLSRVDENCW